MKKYKTEGLTWLEHSIVAFNGSGYADRLSPESFINSYIDYNRWKKRPQGVSLGNQFYQSVLPLAEYLIETSAGPGKFTSQKRLDKFRDFRYNKPR